MTSARLYLGLALCALLVAGCSKRVVVKQAIPEPVFAQRPYTVGLDLDKNLRNHAHDEKLPDGIKWHIELGAANVALFTRLFDGMFQTVQPVNGIQAQPGMAAVIRPDILDYQFSTPGQSKTDYFEAWLKYRLRVYAPGGKLVADWPLTAYGRSRKRFLDADGALNLASRRALRDAAAAVTLSFFSRPGVQALFAGAAPPAAPGHSVSTTASGPARGKSHVQ